MNNNLPAFFLLLPALACALTFDLSTDAALGYETGLYDPADSAYTQNAPFFAASAEPILTQEFSADWSAELSLPASAAIRKVAGNDYSAGPSLALIREWKKKSFQLAGSGEYVSQAGTLDPDQPMKNRLYRLSAEYGWKGAQNLKLSYFLIRLDEIGSDRKDLSNKIRFKVGFKPSDWVLPGIGVGAGLNSSNVRDYRYKEFSFSSTLLLLPDNRNSWFFMVNGSRRVYPGESTGIKKNGASSKMILIRDPANLTDNTALTAAYTRSLSERLDAEISYDFSLYHSGLTRTTDASHKIALGLSWHLKPL
ncbi:MAG: hypothetical protein V1913_12445 [Fibrobacterota bacterium]